MSASRVIESECLRGAAGCLEVPVVDLERYRISPGILRKIPRDFAHRFRCVPMVHNRRRIVLVHDDLADLVFLAADPSLVDKSCGPGGTRELQFAMTTRAGLEATLSRLETLRR